MRRETRYRTYWIAWGVLLVFTLAMLLVELAGFPWALAALFLVVAMLVKAGVIGGWFMHLRYERSTLVLPLVLATLLTAALLFFLIAVDGMAAARLTEGGL